MKQTTISEVQNICSDMSRLLIYKFGDKYNRDPSFAIDTFISYGNNILTILDKSTYYNPFTPPQQAKIKRINLQNKLGALYRMKQKLQADVNVDDVIKRINAAMKEITNAIENALSE